MNKTYIPMVQSAFGLRCIIGKQGLEMPFNPYGIQKGIEIARKQIESLETSIPLTNSNMDAPKHFIT